MSKPGPTGGSNWRPADADTPTLRHWRHRLVEPPGSYLCIAALALILIWGFSINTIVGQRALVEKSALTLAEELADTYEALTYRAVKEIDVALKLLGYSLRHDTPARTLRALQGQGLLPPEFLFTTFVTDASGVVVATTRENGVRQVADQAFFRNARDNPELVVGQPHFDPHSDEWQMTFSRAHYTPDDGFAGVVAVSIHTSYFVSNYETADLGQHGLIGLLGTDGVFRAWRSGDRIHAGGPGNIGSWISPNGGSAAPDAVILHRSARDGVQRYTVKRKLFDLPLAIVVGLSRAEQLAPANQLRRVYLWRALAGSLLVLAILALLGRLSWQLRRERARMLAEREQHARRVEHLAYHDELTGLPNRSFFSRLLRAAMQRARRDDTSLALLFLDLDKFKTINDTLGHDGGDQLLRETARRLQGSVRDSDIVARLGGDEFVVVLPEIGACHHITTVADKILAALRATHQIGGQQIRVTASIGTSVFPADGEDEQTLMKHADAAMYHAKEDGRNNHKFFSRELNTDALRRLHLQTELREALRCGALEIRYQAMRAMDGAAIGGVEALVQWQHPRHGLIPTARLLSLVEDCGLITPILEWLIDRVCRQHVAWRRQGIPALLMAVTLPACHCHPQALRPAIRAALAETGMPARYLEIGISARLLSNDLEGNLARLETLKGLGVQVAISDFGSAYAGLARTRNLPLDRARLDPALVGNAPRSDTGRQRAGAIMALARNLGLSVVVAGVESAAQAEALGGQPGDMLQGTQIHEPMSAAAFARFMGDRRRQHQACDAPHQSNSPGRTSGP